MNILLIINAKIMLFAVDAQTLLHKPDISEHVAQRNKAVSRAA